MHQNLHVISPSHNERHGKSRAQKVSRFPRVSGSDVACLFTKPDAIGTANGYLRSLGADSQSKAEQRPLASVELSEAASVTYTDGTPSKPGRIQRPLTSQEPNWLSEAPVEASAGTRDDNRSHQRPLSSAELVEAATALDSSRTPRSKLRPQRPSKVGDMNDPSIALCSHNTVPGRCPSGLGISCSSSGLGSQQLSCSGGCKDLREQRVHLKHNVWQDSETVSAAADDPHAGESVDAPAGILKQPRDQRSSLRWAMHDQTLQGAPYTGSCGSAVCPAVSVPKCHGERVSSGADDPISGEECLDCAFVQACNAAQEHEASSEQVGGAVVLKGASSRVLS